MRAPALLTVDDATAGRVMTMADIVVGDAVEQTYAFDAGALRAFAAVANDRAPVHGDERFARARGFDRPIVQGLCVSARFSRLIGMYLPGEHAILERLGVKFRRATHEGEVLRYRAEVKRVLAPMKVVVLALSATSGAGEHVVGEAQCLIR